MPPWTQVELFAIDPRDLNRNWLKSPIVRSPDQANAARRADDGAISRRAAHGAGGRAKCDRQPARRKRRRRAAGGVPARIVAVSALMREWFEAEPWRTSRELFERLQTEQPGVFPDGQLRTLQRRMKEWRRDVAHQMVFGITTTGETPVLAPVSPNT